MSDCTSTRNDWQRPGADAIATQTLAKVGQGTPTESQRIVLLHDGGGDRSQTVEALPRIIDGLRAAGYTLVPISQLAGLPANAVNPPVKGADLIQVRADIGIFLVLAALLWLLKWTFFVAIALGIARAVLLAVLAVRAATRGSRPVAASGRSRPLRFSADPGV